MNRYVTLGDLLHSRANSRVHHRRDHSIPGMLSAQDVWVFASDDTRDPDRVYMTIKNPSKGYRPMY